jgi:dUTP pyrophosphatase
MSENIRNEIQVLRLPHAADLPLPAYQSAYAAGLDLVAAVPPHAPPSPASCRSRAFSP